MDKALEDTLDLLSTPGALAQIRQAEANLDAGMGIDADQLRQEFAARLNRENRMELDGHDVNDCL